MFCNQSGSNKFKDHFTMFRKKLLSGIISIFLLSNTFAFEVLSQENQNKDSLLRGALKSSLRDFYKISDPISVFYFERN